MVVNLKHFKDVQTDQLVQKKATLHIMLYIIMYLRTKETNYGNFVKVFIWEKI